MKTLGLLLVFAASLTVAAEAPLHPAPQRAKMACTDALRSQMEADNTAAFQLKSSAYTDGLERGAALGAGGALLVVCLALRAKKPQQGDASSQKPLSRGASA